MIGVSCVEVWLDVYHWVSKHLLVFEWMFKSVGGAVSRSE